MQYKRCKKCQRFFEPLTSNQVFCSVKCYKAFNYRKHVEHHIKECEYCHKKFKAKNNMQRFCSTKCKDNYFKELKNKKVYKKVCAQCGEVFKTTDTRKKYCSHDCYLKAKTIRENKRYKGNTHGRN